MSYKQRSMVFDKWANLTRMTLAFVSCIVFSLETNAEELIELEVRPGVVATAKYWPGESDLPVLILLHGFLQTSNFATIGRLSEALGDEGYTVLTPNLSLGINRRTRSLPCEAVHTHTLEEDVGEIAQWVDWLHKKTGKKVILSGHSTGSLHAIAYLQNTPNAPVDFTILISLNYFGKGRFGPLFEASLFEQKAREALARGDTNLDEYSLAYCKSYITTAQGYLSYHDWNNERVRSAIGQLESHVALIIGSKDDRVDAWCLAELENTGTEINEVPSANHFFDQEHEFELLDQFVMIVESHT